uniref:Wsv131-like protein n=1 Tax=Pasiphaea japonica whispovirus TaxID=2984286 RepID=A0A9C7BRK4_9VIRU|nr:MAG: wsv131-like protein [Pasiphaea japonica whispovirus]
MDYLSILSQEGTDISKNNAVRRMYDNSVGSYVKNGLINADQEYKNIVDITQTQDYLTVENIIGDPDTGERVSPFLFFDIILQSINIKHPSVLNDKQKVLKDIIYAMAVPAIDNLSLPNYGGSLGKDTLDSFRSQLKFGFDPLTEVLKNCCASQTVMHSFLKSNLLTLYEKVKKWASVNLEKDGQEIALCKTIQVIGQICTIIEAAKEATSTTSTTFSFNSEKINGCNGCTKKTCKDGGIVAPFLKHVNSNDNHNSAQAAAALQVPKVPSEFITKSSVPFKRQKLDKINNRDVYNKKINSSLSITETIIKNSTEKIKMKERSNCIVKGVQFVMKQINQVEEKMNTPPKSPTTEISKNNLTRLFLPLPPLPENQQQQQQIGENQQQQQQQQIGEHNDTNIIEKEYITVRPLISPLSPSPPSSWLSDGGNLAPSEQQVQIHKNNNNEALGLTPGSEFVYQRDKANREAMSKYAMTGSGVNTGKYRRFNNTL